MHVNAFTLNWKSWKPYVFAPFALLDRCLAKIEADEVENMAMVIPLWPSAPFFVTMLRHLKEAPVLLPKYCTRNLTLPWDREKKASHQKSKISFGTFVRHLLCTKQIPCSVAKHIAQNAWHLGVMARLDTSTR